MSLLFKNWPLFLASKYDLSGTTKCDQNHALTIMTLVTPKAGAKHELLFKQTH